MNCARYRRSLFFGVIGVGTTTIVVAFVSSVLGPTLHLLPLAVCLTSCAILPWMLLIVEFMTARHEARQQVQRLFL